MANLLYDLRDKIDEILGGTVTDLWLDIAWDLLVSALGYDPSFGEKTDETIGTGDEIVYLEKRPVKTLLEVIINNQDKDIANFKVYKALGCKYLNNIFVQGTLRNYRDTLSDMYNDERIEIRYEGGYTSDEFPNDLLLLVCDMLQSGYKVSDGSSKLTNYSISDISYGFKSYTETSQVWNDTLDKYRSL